MGLPSVICLAILVFGLFRPIRFLLAVSWVLAAFGSLAVIPPELAGGTSILIDTVSLLFIILKLLILPGGLSSLIEGLFNFRRLGLLSTFTLVAIIGAIILPEAFKGAVDVYPMRATQLGSPPGPLAPTTANFTQSAYLIVSLLIAACYCGLARQHRFIDDFGWAVVVGAMATVLTGLLDIVTSRLGIADVLSIFRTANYAFLTAAEVQGVKRTVGLMPEASSFGGLAAFYFSLLLFTRDMYPSSIRSRIVLPVITACGAFAVLSTSSTAYVELGATIGLFLLDGVRRLFFGAVDDRSRKLRELAFLVVALTLMLLGAMFFDETRDSLYSIFDQMILQKTQSASYIERSAWTRVAFEAWLNTDGLGVGVGSARTSNFFVNVLASTGFLGFGLFVLLLIRVFGLRLPKDRRLAELVRGSKLTLVPTLLGAAVAGTTPDYGITNGALFGIIAGAATFNHYTAHTVRPQSSYWQDQTTLLR